MKYSICGAIAVVCVTTSSAWAADLPVKAASVAMPVINDWSGFYLGAHGGYGWGDDPLTISNSPTALAGAAIIPGDTLTGVKSKGWLAGFQFGYNWQYYTSWVAGFEIDLSAANIKGSASTSASTSGTDPLVGPVSRSVLDARSDKFDMLGSGRARLGYLMTPGFLLYGTGGLAWTRFVTTTTHNQSSTFSGVTLNANSVSTAPISEFGWVAGVGGEAKILDSNWLVRLEYLHYDFGDSFSSTITSSNNVTAPTTIGTSSGRLTVDAVRAGVSYKFGGPVLVR